MLATPGCTTRAPAKKPACACPDWWPSPTNTRPVRCGDPHLHTTSSFPTAKPAPTANWYRSTARRCITKPRRPGSSIRPPCAENCTNRWDSSGRPSTPRLDWPSWPGWIATPSPRGRGAPPAARVGRPQPQSRRRVVVVGGAAGGRAESHPPSQTRRARLGHAVGAVARRCARPAPGPRSLRCSACGAAHSGAHPVRPANMPPRALTGAS